MRRLHATALTLTLSLAACDKPPAPITQVIRITATDHAFQIPDSIPSGRVTLRLVNLGQSWHEALLVQLRPGSTVETYLGEVKAGAEFPTGATDLGGPGIVAPGDSSEVILDLTPGSYAVVCWTDNHVKAGMIVPVRAAQPATLATVPADLTELGLADYHFVLSRPRRAGPQVIHLTNRGAKIHEVAIYRLAEGRSLADFGAWLQRRDGLPPASPVGGVASLGAGREAWLTLNLPPGHYFMACGVPEGDQIHAQLGMVQEFTIAS